MTTQWPRLIQNNNSIIPTINTRRKVVTQRGTVLKWTRGLSQPHTCTKLRHLTCIILVFPLKTMLSINLHGRCTKPAIYITEYQKVFGFQTNLFSIPCEMTRQSPTLTTEKFHYNLLHVHADSVFSTNMHLIYTVCCILFRKVKEKN